MSDLTMGPGTDPGTDVGPLVNERTRDRAEEFLADAVDRGALVRAGGHRPAGLGAGYYFEPTLVAGVPEDARIWHDEPFGPVLPVRTFRSIDEALAVANDVGYGLAGYVFTRDLTTAMVVGDRLDVGMIGVNNLVIATAEAPAGGVKDSGFGREGGAEALDDYTTTTYVNIALP
jgi:succinate-semialdehyde dehydrogenase/glutarate-semialdehyde dehydrogenase